MKPKIIVIEGFFYVGEGDGKKDAIYPNLDRAYLSTDNFKLSVRKFNLQDLQVLKLERLYGSLLNSIEVQGVVNTKGSLIPFFIKRQKAKALQKLIDDSRDPSEVIL